MLQNLLNSLTSFFHSLSDYVPAFSAASLADNLAHTLIGIVLGLLGKQIVTWVENKKDERKYRLAGNYITIFDDEKDGRKIVRKGPVKLKQSGKKIRGTTMIDEGTRKRTWVLEGEVKSTGHVMGWYNEEGFDPGTGSFFLKVRGDRDMEGFWSGYDAANKKLNSGKYMFARQPSLSLRSINSTDVAPILEMANQQLGRDYIKPKDILNPGAVSICAEVDGTVVGFCTGKLISAKDLVQDIKGLPVGKFPGLETITTVGLLKSIAVASTHGGKGIGTALFEDCMARLEKRGAKKLFITGWKSKKGVNIASIAVKHGFRSKCDMPKYWAKDSVEMDYSCPECGNPPCQCTAIIFTRP